MYPSDWSVLTSTSPLLRSPESFVMAGSAILGKRTKVRFTRKAQKLMIGLLGHLIDTLMYKCTWIWFICHNLSLYSAFLISILTLRDSGLHSDLDLELRLVKRLRINQCQDLWFIWWPTFVNSLVLIRKWVSFSFRKIKQLSSVAAFNSSGRF